MLDTPLSPLTITTYVEGNIAMATANLKHHDQLSQHLRQQTDKVREQIITAWLDHDKMRTSLIYLLAGKIDEAEELIDDDTPIEGETPVSNNNLRLKRFEDALDQLTLLMGQQFKAMHDLRKACNIVTQSSEEEQEN